MAAVTVAATSLKVTVFFSGITEKLMPVMMTISPAGPLSGEKLAMVGDGVASESVEQLFIRGAMNPVSPRVLRNCLRSIAGF